MNKGFFKFGRYMICFLIMVGICFTSCQRRGTDPVPRGDIVKSALERNLSPQYARGDLDQFVRDNNAFALDLYHAVKGKAENLLYSPYSISCALAMTYAGARGNTEVQMSNTLHFGYPQEELHNLFNGLDLDMNGRGGDGTNTDEKRLTLNILNAVWGRQEYPFLDSYLDVLAVNYDAGIRLVDFITDPESARLLINAWVAEQTGNRIEELLESGIINELTRLVLTNAIYFKAAWAIPFDEELTREGDFFLTDGTSVSVPMMTPSEGYGENNEEMTGTEGPGFKAVELPYYGGEFAMLIVVPDRGTFEVFEQSLDSSLIEGIVDNLEPMEITLTMPKFGYESSYKLEEVLPGMGMTDAFNPDTADFSGIDGGYGDLYISNVIHKAFISVDEAGTEASAATAVVITFKGVSDPLPLSIDRPFIYFIRDTKTGAILFIGRLLNPAPRGAGGL